MDSFDSAAKKQSLLLSSLSFFFSFYFFDPQGMLRNLFQEDNLSKGSKLLVIK